MSARSDLACSTFDCVVVGGGPAGLAAACALAKRGLSIALATQIADVAGGADATLSVDTRTAALFPPAIALLDQLGAWRALSPDCAPLTAIRLVDDTGSLLRAPEVLFSARDIGLDDLGYNVPNEALNDALTAAARALDVTIPDDGRALAVESRAELATIRLSRDRALTARLVIAADGRASMARDAAGIQVQRWSYDQAALACRFSHSRPHHGVSTELHGAAGPCTTVPLAGCASSLVWMHRPAEIGRLSALPPAAFLDTLSERLGCLLGTLTDLGSRRCFPLSGLVAETMGRARVALVGEAGHALPPIGAQGLNLGLVDAAVLADTVAAASARGDDIGGASTLAAYHAARSADVRRRVGAVDLLNRSSDTGFGALNLARGAGLHVLAAMPSLRRRLMLEGLYPPAPLPSLMQMPRLGTTQ